ncbi:O-antigen ligase family protein [Desertifilum sp. FACHB-1129]|uniref:O-antigen ligase-related domain-containing protein n=2 Tax=Desertifilum tharense IPPAS B-1220 TaxID=1781255 RepID=A0A1E5QIX2_9CYAN|nr:MULTISPECIES: O-antigen ligase family protein [Desertifilum]MDA0210535.1 O-antigen ligase family protein [Cyanobacteria bacterium FC1]MBD2311535.1 O-antigen ligase family protein [Desertifilum sp. FACHB-1129]MBD2323109.1 O-antigen ligase family protein [Desertifilum sp. FACHB-866]MBD2332954.1 O-antigen ligase family protein [Desertifilum sp. FACHB-868]OEJ74561.1 hypothetical protein BH720_13885 [Desertifilum tharense IPPAS B-1220]
MPEKALSFSENLPQNRKKSRFVIKIESLAFWFWFFLSIEGCLTFVFFQSKPALGTAVSYLPPISLAGFLLSSLLIGGRLRNPEIFQSFAAKCLLLLTGWAGLSLFWTGASPRFSAMGYWLTLTLKIAVVILTFLRADIDKVAIKSLQGLAWGGLVYALVPFLFNARTVEGRLGHELFLHPNDIGNRMAINCLCTMFLALESWGTTKQQKTYLYLLMFQLFTLLTSLSKTSIAAFLISALIYIFCSKISIKKKLMTLGGTSLLLAASLPTLGKYLNEYLNEQQGGEALTTASGRTVLWEIAWEMIQENPVWGYGYQSYRDVAPQVIAIRLVHPHNEWLNVWFNLGGVGLILGILTYLAYIGLIWRAKQAQLPQSILGLSLLIYVLIRGLTEANVPDFLVYPSVLMMLLIGWMTPRKAVRLGKNDD